MTHTHHLTGLKWASLVDFVKQWHSSFTAFSPSAVSRVKILSDQHPQLEAVFTHKVILTLNTVGSLHCSSAVLRALVILIHSLNYMWKKLLCPSGMRGSRMAPGVKHAPGVLQMSIGPSGTTGTPVNKNGQRKEMEASGTKVCTFNH